MTELPVHHVPPTRSDERMHLLDDDECWCHPLTELICDMEGYCEPHIFHRGPDDALP